MKIRLALALGVALLSTFSAAAAQQEDKCDLIESVRTDVQTPTVFVQGPFLFTCTSGAELRADQGTLNQTTGELLLVGHVAYLDPERTLDADQATYTRATRRLYATGNVVFTNRVEGTTIRGPELEYFATSPDRPEAQVNAGNRPHLTLMPRDTAGSRDPLEIDADRLTIIGNDDLTAFGNVVMKRPDLDATAEEARYNGELETLELRRKAVVKGKDNVLRGELIEAQLENDVLKEVRSREHAVLEAKDMRVTAPDVHLFFREELVERTVARSDSTTAAADRPLAVTKTFRLVADSIDAVAPGQELETVTAIGRARGETIDTTRAAPAAGSADSATTEESSLIASDWIAGDTIVGHFSRRDSTTAAGSTESADTAIQLDRIIARGTALSLYHIQEDTTRADTAAATRGRRGVNFVSAQVITLSFKEGEVDVAELHGVKRGIYLDPAPAGAPPTAPAAPAGGGTPPATPAPTAGAGRE
jgi:lipopolysaccharide export system protein LptA